MDELQEEFSARKGQGQEAFGTPSCSAAQPPLSDGAPPPSHWLNRDTLDNRFLQAFERVPERLQILTLHAADQWEMGPAPILATLLHVLAGAAGSKHRIRRAHLGFSCPFSLVVCGDGRSRQNWMEFLAEPWLGHLRRRLRMHQAFGAKHFISEAKSLDQQSGYAFGTFTDKERLVINAHLNLAPCAMERSPLPGKLMDALRHSFSRTVVSLNGGIDPMVELSTAGQRRVTEMCRLLEMSWRDMDLPGKGPISRRGVIHLLWRTEAAAARKIVSGRKSPWSALVPPALLLREGSSPPYLVPLHAETFAGWETLLKELISGVEANHDAVVWALSPEADTLAADFCRDLLVPSTALAGVTPSYFCWFHELVIRLAMLLSILDRLVAAGPETDAVVSEETMDRACFLGWWLAHEHYECLNWLRSPCTVDVEGDLDDVAGIDTIDEDQVQRAILEKLAAQGPLSRRELSRSFHVLQARNRDRIISRLKKQDLVIETDDGRVGLAGNATAVASKC